MTTMKALVAFIISWTFKFGVIICSTDRWPLGTYTLPKPKSGCPHAVGSTWQEAWRYQDLENDARQGSKFSSNFHMDAKITNNNIIRQFCTSSNEQAQEPWPEGSYCIYRNSNYCPPNMTQGFIDWYDEQTNNENEFHRYLTLPDGIYFGPSTRLLYCCHTAGKWYKSIELPTENPFYLLPYGSQNCQRVMGAVSSLEYIVYDTEDENNLDEFNGHHVFTDKLKSLPKVFYCYYEGCQHKLRNNSGSFSSPNFLNDSYPDFQFCSWSITVGVSLRISLTFQTLNVPNCDENTLDIYDGRSAAVTSALLARFCGENATSAATLKSKTNSLFIVSKSGNNSVTSVQDLPKSLQFHAEYEAFHEATPATTTITTIPTTTRATTSTTPPPQITTLPATPRTRTTSTTTAPPPTTTHATTARKTTTSPMTTTMVNTAGKRIPTTSTTKSLKINAYLSRITAPTTSPTTTPFSARVKAPGAAKNIPFTQKLVFISTMHESLATTGTSTTISYENERMESQNSNSESSIYLLTTLLILAILISMVVVGTIVYWRRHKRKDATTINCKSGTRV